MARPETRFVVAADGAALAYQVWGDGPIDLVWSFAFLSNVDVIWEFPPLATFLESLASFSRLIVHDRRGMGRSGGRLSQDLDRDCDDLQVLLDEVGAERSCLGGPVTGGAHSAAFAAKYPERVSSVVWYGAFAASAKADDYPWAFSAEEQDELERDTAEHWTSEARAARFVQAWAPSIAADPEAIRFFARWAESSTSAADAAALQRFWYGTELRKELSSLRVPTLIIHREALEHEEDLYAASLIPNAEVAAVPGTDFMPFVGETDQVVQEIREFALRHAGPG